MFGDYTDALLTPSVFKLLNKRREVVTRIRRGLGTILSQQRASAVTLSSDSQQRPTIGQNPAWTSCGSGGPADSSTVCTARKDEQPA